MSKNTFYLRMEMKTVKRSESVKITRLSYPIQIKIKILKKTALNCEHLNIEIMIKIEIDDVTVNNTSSILSFLFCHLSPSPSLSSYSFSHSHFYILNQ